MFFALFALLPFFISLPAVDAATNDWSIPCTRGECYYDMPSADGMATGSMKIWGSPNAISDITPAAGWAIIGCDKEAMEQDIRLVCTKGGECEHLLQNGAEGKLVRLPENCLKTPFARVSRSWVHEDQTLPADVSAKLARRADEIPQVRGLALDTNFTAVDPSKSGDVSIAIQGATVAGENGNATITPPASTPPGRRRSEAGRRRALFSFIEGAFKNFNSFSKDKTIQLPPLKVPRKSVTVFDEKITCGKVQGAIKADASLQADALVTVGIAATGTIIPPKFSAFGIFAQMNGEIDGTLSLDGSVSGSIDIVDKVIVAPIGIPGLNFPGILTVGPSFKVVAEGKANMELGMKLDLPFNYKMNDVKLFFPPSAAQKSVSPIEPAQSPLTLSADATVAGKVDLEAHIIPQLDIGITALGGTAKANIFLNLDASAKVGLKLNGNAKAAVTTAKPKKRAEFNQLAARQAATAASAGVEGCVDITAGLSVDAGVDANFFGLFDPTTKLNLFSKQFELFSKCFGAATKREYSEVPQYLHKRALTCTRTSDPASIVSVVKEIAVQIKAKAGSAPPAKIV
ncbi:hypothetical protein CCMSSC00406_0007677 [Pleurotus cornucopiae]|uniref:Uncharacterized protein n=1 Tax=Pleurotus cornucopiae TaxID=5321 RepID=A0ACB7J3V7_PLECO|nr:hypothetical protein CCMSSC00406_0007677 [Pleurotus cornucopiae]